MSEQREQFQRRVEDLVAQFERDVDPNEWVTRRYPKRMRDDDREVYEVPALYLQKGPVKLLLDPIGYDFSEADAGADLYLMPAYDPTTSLNFKEGQWKFFHADPADHTSLHTGTSVVELPLDAATIDQVLNVIADHAILSI